jgi:ATP-dependent helicase HrpB
VARALCAGVRSRGLHVLPWCRETTQLRERLAFARALEGEPWPDATEEALAASLDAWLAPFLGGLRSLEDLGRLDLREALLSLLPWERRQELDRLAPTHLEVPSGSRVQLDYADPSAPVLAVRLQEVFGLRETPRVGGGRVPLTVHLLSPARRPVQVTRTPGPRTRCPPSPPAGRSPARRRSGDRAGPALS